MSSLFTALTIVGAALTLSAYFSVWLVVWAFTNFTCSLTILYTYMMCFDYSPSHPY